MSEPDKRQDLPWFVAQLRPQGLRRALDHLQRQKFETFAPEFVTVAVRAGVAKQIRKPLFPGYIFVSFDPTDRSWSSINATRGVLRLISNTPSTPTPLPKPLMAGILSRCDSSGLILPPSTLKAGDRIRVLAGPFAEIVTTIEMVPDQARISVLIDLMGRKVKATLPRDQIEKLK